MSFLMILVNDSKFKTLTTKYVCLPPFHEIFMQKISTKNVLTKLFVIYMHLKSFKISAKKSLSDTGKHTLVQLK